MLKSRRTGNYCWIMTWDWDISFGAIQGDKKKREEQIWGEVMCACAHTLFGRGYFSQFWISLLGVIILIVVSVRCIILCSNYRFRVFLLKKNIAAAVPQLQDRTDLGRSVWQTVDSLDSWFSSDKGWLLYTMQLCENKTSLTAEL